jgi:hypothetical protein
VFTARYALSPYIKQIRFVFKGLKWHFGAQPKRMDGTIKDVRSFQDLFFAILCLAAPLASVFFCWRTILRLRRQSLHYTNKIIFLGASKESLKCGLHTLMTPQFDVTIKWTIFKKIFKFQLTVLWHPQGDEMNYYTKSVGVTFFIDECDDSVKAS